MFHCYPIGQEILSALEGLGYQEPTSIQKEVIPAMLAGSNIVAKAPTGSGKTAAFAIPICEQVNWEENAPQALILEPTRELTDQVREEIFHIGRKKRIKVPALFGGFPIDKQIQTLRQKSHIVVGTPGRVMDHIRRESVILNQITWVVLDEADLMLDMGFLEEVKIILSYLPKGCKIALFSATLKPEIQVLVEEFVTDAVLILQEQTEDQTQAITERICMVNPEDKYESFQRILIQANPESCMIFCGTREMVNVLFQKLRKNRIFCGMLHGEIDQRERLKTVDAFRRGCFRFLIATDVAARGIDFDDITHVMNYDFPTGKETYVHRIGRTGRNGKSGSAVSLVTEAELHMLRQVETYIGHEIPVIECPQVTKEMEKAFWEKQRRKRQEKQKKGAALNAEITRIAIGGGRKSKIRAGDIVGAICGIDGVSPDDIGIIDIRDSISYVEIQNGKGNAVLACLQTKPIKGKMRKVRQARM